MERTVSDDVLQWGDENPPFTYEYTSYCDRPIYGWAKLQSSGQLFGWVCVELLRDLLWHWTFVEVGERERPGEVKDFLDSVRGTSGIQWMSVIEDRRTKEGRFFGVWMDGPVDDDL